MGLAPQNRADCADILTGYLTLRDRHHWQAAMALSVHRAHSKGGNLLQSGCDLRVRRVRRHGVLRDGNGHQQKCDFHHRGVAKRLWDETESLLPQNDWLHHSVEVP